MLQETIAKIENRLRSSSAISATERTELIKLLGELGGEISALSHTHREQAQSIVLFTDLSAHEATREAKNPAALRHSLGGLESSVDEFEETHPKLTNMVNRLAGMLANMGI